MNLEDMSLKIKDLDHLRDLCSKPEEPLECFVLLGGGLVRSSKRISHDADDDTFDVHNEIDDSWQDDLTEEQLREETNLITALEQGALYMY